MFDEYKSSIVNIDRDVINRNIYYDDLDNDGTSEKLIFEQTYPNLVSLTVSVNNKVIDQWNFEGRLPAIDPPHWGDIDGDGVKEIFIFTYIAHTNTQNNLIYINCVNPISRTVLIKNKPVVEYVPFDDKLDCTITSYGFHDFNNDGHNEFYFSTSVAYSRKPRQFFVFDPARDSILQSPESFAAFTKAFVFDFNNQRTPDFIFATDATGNWDSSTAYSDMFAWLMVFSNDASFRFPPVNIGRYPSRSRVIPFTYDDTYYFITLNIYFGNDSSDCSLAIYDTDGKMVNIKYFPYSHDWFFPRLYYDTFANPDFFYIIKNNGNIEKRSKNLEIRGALDIPKTTTSSHFELDVDDDGKKELLFQGEDLNDLIIARNDLSNYLIVSLSGTGHIKTCSLIRNDGEQTRLFVLFNDVSYLLQYESNILFYLKYPIYAIIYVVVLSIILLIQKTQKQRAELKYETEKRIAELQLKAMKNQLDPHFTLNIINSIGSLFYKQDKEKADYIFGKYSKLLRSTILNSDKIVTTLSNELEYVENYLELEKFRHDNRFGWRIMIDDNVNSGINIPKMLIHTFVENSVKHGLKHREKDGELSILISPAKNEYTISIADNGIGRKHAKDFSLESIGKGLSILDQILDLYFNLMKIRITYTVKDVIDIRGTSAGTEVFITIPIFQN